MYDTILFGDCLDLMARLPDASVDMILSDLPYGETARNPWDKVIPCEPLWAQYKRVTKPNAAIVLTATMRFASQLVASNPKMFRYDLVWRKNKASGHLNAKKMPLRSHEIVLVFYRRPPVYHPQKTQGHKPGNAATHTQESTNYGRQTKTVTYGGQTDRYPTSVLDFSVLNNDSPERIHPTQKPVDMFEWLIRTYTDPGALVLDNCIGSGTTAVACIRAGRHFLGMEADPDIYAKAIARLAGEQGGASCG